MSRKKKNAAQQRQTSRELIDIQKITEYGLLTSHGELVFFSIEPTNLSVHSPESIGSRIYAGYVSSGEAIDYLPPALVAALRGTVEDSEHRIARLLFKLAVETSMMMNVLAAGMEISEEDLRQLRARCVREVKQTNGNISLKDAVKYQKGQE